MSRRPPGGPPVVWLLGPTSSGKTVLGRGLVERLRAAGRPALHFDSDEVRDFFGDHLGFDEADRLRVVTTLIHLAAKGAEAGIWVVVSALTAHRAARDLVRRSLDNLVFASVECSIEECARRDPKGLYGQAREGEIDTLIGVNTPYPPATDADIVLNTETTGVEPLLDDLWARLAAKADY